MSNTITLDKKFEMAYNCAVNIIKRRNASGANVKYSVGYEDINPFEEERAIGSILSTLNIDQLTQIAKLAIEQKKSEQYRFVHWKAYLPNKVEVEIEPYITY